MLRKIIKGSLVIASKAIPKVVLARIATEILIFSAKSLAKNTKTKYDDKLVKKVEKALTE